MEELLLFILSLETAGVLCIKVLLLVGAKERADEQCLRLFLDAALM